VVKSDATLAAEIFRKIEGGAKSSSGSDVLVRSHPDTAAHLETERREAMLRLREIIGRTITIQAMPSYQREQYDVTFR
jgi:Ribonuclease G/E